MYFKLFNVSLKELSIKAKIFTLKVNNDWENRSFPETVISEVCNQMKQLRYFNSQTYWIFFSKLFQCKVSLKHSCFNSGDSNPNYS